MSANLSRGGEMAGEYDPRVSAIGSGPGGGDEHDRPGMGRRRNRGGNVGPRAYQPDSASRAGHDRQNGWEDEEPDEWGQHIGAEQSSIFRNRRAAKDHFGKVACRIRPDHSARGRSDIAILQCSSHVFFNLSLYLTDIMTLGRCWLRNRCCRFCSGSRITNSSSYNYSFVAIHTFPLRMPAIPLL